MPQQSVLLSSAFFPPVGWFSLLLRYSVFIESQENFQRQTYRNRCVISSERGTLPLTVPVNKPGGNHTSVTEVRIFNGEKWYLKHWRAIQSAYEASPYFLYYSDDIKPFFSGEYENIFDFNLEIIKKLCDLIEITPQFEITTSFEKKPKNHYDLRQAFSPKKTVSGHFPIYPQVFIDRHGFIPNLSILDVLFNLGPESKSYLARVSVTI
jgi:hypothetical protein